MKYPSGPFLIVLPVLLTITYLRCVHYFTSTKTDEATEVEMRMKAFGRNRLHKAPSTSTKDDVIDICIIASGPEVLEEYKHLIKSIYVHSFRRDIFFHFLTGEGTEKEIAVFMSMIRNPFVNFKYEIKLLDKSYVQEQAATLMTSITHHAGMYGYSKAFIYNIWSNLDRCMILDTDIVFGADPALFWEEFDTMTSPEAIMMKVSNISRDKCGAGIMLQDFKLLRELKFHKLLRTIVYQCGLQTINGTIYHDCVGDQWLYYLAYKNLPRLFHPIPDSWNLEFCHYFNNFTFEHFTNISDTSDLFFGLVHFNCFFGGTEWPLLPPSLKKYLDWLFSLHIADLPQGQGKVSLVDIT